MTALELIARLLAVVLILAVVSLSTYRMARMMARERGPWDVFRRFRFWTVTVAERDPNYEWLEFGAQCVKCLSVWVGVLFGLAASPILAIALWQTGANALKWITILPFSVMIGLAASALAWRFYESENRA